jgi:hypothetical protein
MVKISISQHWEKKKEKKNSQFDKQAKQRIQLSLQLFGRQNLISKKWK